MIRRVRMIRRVTDDPEDYDSIRAASDGSGLIGRKFRRVRIK